MIALRHAETGEIQIMASAEAADEQGYAAPDWQEIAVPPGDGWRWDSAAETWLPPAPPRIWRPVDFLSALFTPAEVVALDMLPAEPPGAPALRYAVTLAKMVDRVNLDDPATAQLLAMCVAAGVLSEARAARILAALPPQ